MQVLISLNTLKTDTVNLHVLHVSVGMVDNTICVCMSLIYVLYCDYWSTSSINVQLTSNTLLEVYGNITFYNGSTFIRKIFSSKCLR
jgi:hypothetical protein